MSKGKRGGHASKFYREIDKEPRYDEARRIEKECNRERRARRKAFQN